MSEQIRLTPKGFFCGLFLESIDDSLFDTPEQKDEYIQEQWHRFEAFLIKRLHEQDPTAIYPALIFNGEGGEIIGATMAEDV